MQRRKSESDSPTGFSRRRFVSGGSGAAGAGVLILKPKTVFGSQANSAVEVGIAGVGGRGNWIGNFFVEQAGARVVALADVFHDRLETGRARFGVAPSRVYRGVESYRELAASRLDAVVVESPPYYHPEHVAAAVAAGKHVFLAKPVAVDVPGCRSIRESGERAKGKVSFLVDFQTRAAGVSGGGGPRAPGRDRRAGVGAR